MWKEPRGSCRACATSPGWLACCWLNARRPTRASEPDGAPRALARGLYRQRPQGALRWRDLPADTAFPAASRAPEDAAANAPATQALCAPYRRASQLSRRRSRSGQMALAQCGVRGYFRRTSASSRRQHRGDQGTAARAFARAGCRSAPRGWIHGHRPFLLRVHLQGLGRASSMRGYRRCKT